MGSRDRRESLDQFEILIRESLAARAGGRAPAPQARRGLLQRAAREQRRFSWRLPVSLPGLFNDGQSRLTNQSTQHHRLYLEALFGPRLGWFSFNQFMR